MSGVTYAADGFSTALVKRPEDGWLGFLEPAVLGGDDGTLGALLRSTLVGGLVMFGVDVVLHWIQNAPWASWSLSLRRGQLRLRLRGRRRRQPLAHLRKVDVDDYGLSLRFVDGSEWTIPPQPAAVVDLYELAEHLRRAARSEREAEREHAEAAVRAREALREVRSAGGRRT